MDAAFRNHLSDFVIFDVDAPWRIAVDAFHSKCRNSPFDGRPTQGRVLRTVVAGRSIYADDAKAS